MEDLIKNNIGLIMHQLKRMKVIKDPDAESIGYEALFNAAQTYDPTKGYKFSTYATCCIYNALGSYIRTLNKKRQLDVISYNNIAYTEDGVQHEFAEFLESDTNIEEEYIKKEICEATKKAYYSTYNRLTNKRHKMIINLWHKSDYTMSNKEIATLVGVSQPYVNQVINTFKYKLRKKLEVYL